MTRPEDSSYDVTLTELEHAARVALDNTVESRPESAVPHDLPMNDAVYGWPRPEFGSR